MAFPGRPAGPSKKMSTMRPLQRPAPNRAQTATPTLNGRASPADSITSKPRTPKRKAMSEVADHDAAEETNINVFVRCRGRNDREVKENSGVVVSTDGVKGNKVELSMGPNALSNKTYAFDKVFSPAADQGIIFDEVVDPILNEVLNGFNCTIFAYGQTGTGKTYTMSGDIADILPIPEQAGIVPRVLHRLFDRLSDDEQSKNENDVKVSFIELYNEELKDLLAVDDTTKLKIYDDANKQGRTTTHVQGMGETHIKSASKGIALLRSGSHKRQVAATKCNDLSSRSHTVFTVTVYMKRQTATGEDYVSAGKLNLVDLAGSENIQRSGAENKRATEAGLINKSLLTLGRVINALVDKSSHIPYRESNLTRLLQDSLGGRTKTCIIATLSPAKSNLEETISTLDYAFRAKNIRNKPQMNQTVSKKTLLREYTAEIEKLKSDLIATRQRNGVYLTSESYEEITTESESRRILSEEQRDKIETMEANLRNKVQELFVLTTNFQSVKRDNERTRQELEGTRSVLDKTELVLAHTKRNLSEETTLRKAHERTEERLAELGQDLLGTLETTTDHVGKLHSKLRRRSDLQSVNRTRWGDSQARVADVTGTVEKRIECLRGKQEGLLASLSGRMQSFVTDELRELQTSQAFLQDKSAAFQQSEAEVNTQTSKAKENMDQVLQEITSLRADVKLEVGNGLNDLSSAAERISAGIASELDAFHGQLQDSYVSLGREFKAVFEDMIKRMNEQQAEADKLRQQISTANNAFVTAGESSQAELQRAIDDERQTAAAERAALLAKVSSLINDSAATQEARMTGYLESANKRVKTSAGEYRIAQQHYGDGMVAWKTSSQALIDSSVRSRDAIKTKLKSDWTKASEQTTKLTGTTKAVHGETVRIVDGQMAQMDNQLVALEEIVSRVREQNEEHHKAHTSSLSQLAGNVQESYHSIGEHLKTSYSRTQALDTEMQERASALSATLPGLDSDGDIRRPLHTLRDNFLDSKIEEYTATGDTPAKTTYAYSTVLPRTEPHDALLERLRGGQTQAATRSPQKSPRKAAMSPNKRAAGSPAKLRSSPTKIGASSSPSKSTTLIFTDARLPTVQLPGSEAAPDGRPASAAATTGGLRELDVNVAGAASGGAKDALSAAEHTWHGTTVAEGKKTPAGLKRQKTDPLAVSVSGDGRSRKHAARATVAAEGRENVAPGGAGLLSASVGPGSGGSGGRRLRSRGSD